MNIYNANFLHLTFIFNLLTCHATDSRREHKKEEKLEQYWIHICRHMAQELQVQWTTDSDGANVTWGNTQEKNKWYKYISW